MTKPESEILPCPFCGESNNTDILDTGVSSGWIVTCGYCGCQLVCNTSYENAIKAWNTRSEPLITDKENLPCREAFEEWVQVSLKYPANSFADDKGGYNYHDLQNRWEAWQAAWNRTQPAIKDNEGLIKEIDKHFASRAIGGEFTGHQMLYIHKLETILVKCKTALQSQPHVGDAEIVDPDIQQGTPCVKNTRIPIWCIIDVIKDCTSYTDLLMVYPGLTNNQVKVALEFVVDKLKSYGLPVSQNEGLVKAVESFIKADATWAKYGGYAQGQKLAKAKELMYKALSQPVSGGIKGGK